MPAPILKAFIPELGAEVGISICKPLKPCRDHHGDHKYLKGYIHWMTVAHVRNNFQSKWAVTMVEASTTQNEANNFDHVCVVEGQAWFYDVVRDSAGKGTTPFWVFPQPKRSIVICHSGLAFMVWCKGTSDDSERIAKRRKADILG